MVHSQVWRRNSSTDGYKTQYDGMNKQYNNYPQTLFPSSWNFFSQLCHINRNIKHLNFVPNFKLNHSKLTKSSHVCHSSHKAELRSQRHFFHKVKIYVVLNNGCTTGFLSRKGNIFWRKCKNARLQWKLQRIDFKMLKCLSFRNDLSVSNRWTQRN